MNDRYLYRAKRKDNCEWVFGGLSYCEKTNAYFITNMGKDHISYICFHQEVDSNTICKCTGLKDKNGKLIWENDIIEAWSQGRRAIGKIKHRIDGTWIMYPAWQNGEMWYLLPNDKGITTVEVIGNIFDNPELLEE